MKEMNLPETQLRSWRPRRPSAGLKQRIFIARTLSLHQIARAVGWFTPATACVFLIFLVLNSENTTSISPGSQEPILATIMSNQNYTMRTASHNMGQNDLFAVTFDWTNRSGSTSSMGFPRFGKSLN
jgi:energy-coupling factor transporter ATP-binding protein EcfA2